MEAYLIGVASGFTVHVIIALANIAWRKIFMR